MLRPAELFEGPVLDPEAFNRVLDAFGEASNYFYHGWDFEGHDHYPEFPIAVEHDQGGFLVWVMALVVGNRAGKALLVGATKVRGFKDTLHSGFEVLPGIPVEMNEEARKHALHSLRKRMRFGTIILARRCGLTPFNGTLESTNEPRSLLPNAPADDSQRDWEGREPENRRRSDATPGMAS